jgi:hypothetical protein
MEVVGDEPKASTVAVIVRRAWGKTRRNRLLVAAARRAGVTVIEIGPGDFRGDQLGRVTFDECPDFDRLPK